MRIDNIRPTYSFCAPTIDAEHKEIMQRLLSYGVIPSGDKATDRATLRRIEEQKAKQEKVVTNKYLTVSSEEIRKWIEKCKEDKKINEPKENDKNNLSGIEITAYYNVLEITKRRGIKIEY